MELTAFVMSFVVLLRKRLRWESYNFRYSGPKAQRHLPGLKSGLKPRPNDRNMPTQHVATLLGATCCVRLATVLRCVATCWVLLAQI